MYETMEQVQGTWVQSGRYDNELTESQGNPETITHDSVVDIQTSTNEVQHKRLFKVCQTF